MTNPDHLRGPWQAVISHRDYAYADLAEARNMLCRSGEVDISVRRGAAIPTDGCVYMHPDGDLAYELEDIRLDDTSPIGAEARYAQAQAMAAGQVSA